MIDGTVKFPTTVWDGLSDNPLRISRINNQEPDYRDWDQLVAEVIAMQTRSINFKQVLQFDLVSGAQTTGTDKSRWIYVPNDMTLIKAVAMVKTANTGSTFIVDIMRDATGDGATFATLWSTTGNRPIIADGAKVGVSAAPNTTDISAGNILRLDIIQIGSSIAGSNLSVALIGYPR